jgi:hypothetical protein
MDAVTKDALSRYGREALHRKNTAACTAARHLDVNSRAAPLKMQSPTWKTAPPLTERNRIT